MAFNKYVDSAWVGVIWLRTEISSWLMWSHIDPSIPISFKHVAVLCHSNWINCHFHIRHFSIWIFCLPFTYIQNSCFLWSPPPQPQYLILFLIFVVFLRTLSLSHTRWLEWHDGWWIMNWEGYGSERLWSHLRSCLHICLDLQGK